MNARTDHTRWLDEALAQIPDDLTAGDTCTTHRQIVGSYLLPLLKRCRATTRPRFWQWLRLQLAKSEETAGYLLWMRELKCPLEVIKPTASTAGFAYTVNGGTALIDVSSSDHPAVWRVPVSRLQWALSMYPVSLKRLPALESETMKQIRKLKRQFKNKMPFLTPAQREDFLKELSQLESMSPVDTSPHRYMLIKYKDGRETPVHRLYLDAGPNDEVDCIDGDYLNFGMTKVRVTVEPVVTSGFAIAKGNRQPKAWEQEVAVQNFLITNNPDMQKDFENSFLQVKTTPQGDIKTSLRIQSNADLGKRTGVNGRVMDCGDFDPLTPDERKLVGLQGADVRPVDEEAALRRKWAVPTNLWGIKWG